MQRNALRSWLLLAPDVQIILFGDAEGAQEVAWELGLHYEQFPQRTKDGSVRLDYLFATAQRQARYNVLCYVPCDTLLLPDFCAAFNRVEALYREFVMVGSARNLPSGQQCCPASFDWQSPLRAQREPDAGANLAPGVGYFAFSKGRFLVDVPAIPSDSPGAVEWLLRKAIGEDVATVDATAMVAAVRQEDGHAESRGAGGDGIGAIYMGERRWRKAVPVPYVLTADDVVVNRWKRLRSWHAQLGRSGGQVWRAWRELSRQLRRTRELPAAHAVRPNGVLR